MSDNTDAMRLLETLHDEDRSIHVRLTALRGLGEIASAQSTNVIETLKEIATSYRLDPRLSYAAGVALARSAKVESGEIHKLSYEALFGWWIETDRQAARRKGTIAELRRHSDSETWEHLRRAQNGTQTIDDRVEAVIALAYPAEDEELMAIDVLIDLAGSERVSEEVSTAAGIAFARLLWTQGVEETGELVQAFTENAHRAYVEEARRVVGDRGTGH
jgi:hypothetical protein